MFKPAAIFSDHMVLQRGKRICVFGKGESGSQITVKLFLEGEADLSSARAICREGRWTAYLPEREAAAGLIMEITDGTETIRYQDIVIGEVWLAGGQSNMELELQNALGGQELLENGTAEGVDYTGVRFYYTPKLAYRDEHYEEETDKSCWELFDREAAAKWSAVGVYFAGMLSAKLGVTVGIVGCNWGGTSASCWMSREALLEQEATRCYVEDYESSDCIKKPEAEQIREYKEYQIYQEDWDKRAAAVYEKEPMIPFDEIQQRIGPCQYPGPMNCANFTRPFGLYETMLRQVCPYTLRGFLFYQGESDEDRADRYYALFGRMISQWREDWQEPSLPFLMVQLPMHRYQHDSDTRSWCLIRESQMKVYQTLRNTGIAVAIDCGQFHEIHPRNKKPVGERLALQALAQIYGSIPKSQAFGPVYRDFLYRDGGMELFFDYAEEGMYFRDGCQEGFELAGPDGVFYPAKAELEGNKIFLRSAGVEEPVMARYLWTNYGEVSVFGANHLPMAPFRTHKF